MFAGVWYVATVVAVGGNVMQQRCQCAIPCSISVHDFFRPAHVRRNVRIDTQRILAILVAHGAAKLILVKFRYSTRQQRMLGFTFRFVFGKARHIQADWPCGTQHQINPVQRLVRCQQRIAFSGQRFGFIFVHRKDRDVVFEELLPPLRILGNDKLGAQRQHHRYVIFLRVLNSFHGCFRHGFTRLATHQIRGENQSRGSGNHIFRNTFSPQLVHVAGADSKGTFPGLANQRKATTNRAIHAL